MFSADKIRAILEKELPDCSARVVDTAGDGEHFAAEVTSSAFAGKRLLAQHQLVYAALGDHMISDIHALALKTTAPTELSE